MPYDIPDYGPVRVRHSFITGEIPTVNELEEGEIALNSADGIIYYQSAAGTITSTSGGIAEAPQDGATYGRKDGGWVDLASSAALQFRQGTDADRLNLDPVPASGEPIYTTDTKRLFIGDGVTAGGRGIVGDTDAYVVCQPGDNIQEKYDQAKALTPGGAALSATNRAALIIFPGTYTINTAATGAPFGSESQGSLVGLNIDTDYVDVLGLGSAPWVARCRLTGSTALVRIAANDVVVQGINASVSYATAGGSARFIVNCQGNTVYSCVNIPATDGLPAVIGGTLIGCNSGTMIGNVSNLNASVFTGELRDCQCTNLARNVVFQGVARNCVFTPVSFGLGLRIFQGWFQHSAFPNFTGSFSTATIASTANGGTAIAAFSGTCTISAASPAVITKTAHGLLGGTRVKFSSTGTLPSGLSSATTYYVTTTTADTFQVSTTRNGTSVNTTDAGTGDHSIVKPSGVEGGYISYCTTATGEATTP